MSQFVTSTSHYSKKKALKRCLIGGWFGWHCYYVGRIGKGIFYTCTFGGFGFMWMQDVVTILRGRFRDQYGEYLKED